MATVQLTIAPVVARLTTPTEQTLDLSITTQRVSVGIGGVGPAGPQGPPGTPGEGTLLPRQGGKLWLVLTLELWLRAYDL